QNIGGVLARELLFESFARILGDAAGPCQIAWNIDLDARDVKTNLTNAPCDLGESGDGNRGLGGSAAEVDARAAQVLALGDRHRLARRNEIAREGKGSLAGPDDQNVEMSHGASPHCRRILGADVVIFHGYIAGEPKWCIV